jgi:hypothetical protein
MLGLLLGCAMFGCGPGTPEPARPSAAPAWQWSGIRDVAGVRGVSIDDSGVVYLTASSAGRHRVMATEPGGAPRWELAPAQAPGPLAVAGNQVVVTLTSQGSAPLAAVVAVTTSSGAQRWHRPLLGSDWVLLAAVSGEPDGSSLIAGSFSGNLRIGDHVVSSAGSSDGFVARLAADGSATWLVRLGGLGADLVSAVCAADGAIFLGGTISGEALLGGLTLTLRAPRSLAGDGFVASLDLTGAPRWAQVLGGSSDDAVTGVAALGGGRVAVAATVRGEVEVGSDALVVQGASDGLLGIWSTAGAYQSATLLGGRDFDGIRGLAASPGHHQAVVTGWFSGSMAAGSSDWVAGGGQDFFAVTTDRDGAIAHGYALAGEGMEEIVAVAASTRGVALVVTYDAPTVLGGTALPAPLPGETATTVAFRPW